MPFTQPMFWALPRSQVGAVRWSAVLQAPSAALMTVAEAKLHARLPADLTTEDVPVANWLKAAQQQVELDTGIKLLTQTWDLVGDAFPYGAEPIVLPFGPLQSVSYIKRYDNALPSVLQTIASTDYIADTVRIPARIGLIDTATWPTDLRAFQPISLRVIVGYASVAAIPEPLLQAVRLAIAWHAANREPTALETASYDWLIDNYRPVVVP